MKTPDHTADTFRRLLAKTVCMILCLALIPLYAVTAERTATADGNIRVYLSSLGSPLSLQLTVYGDYAVNGQSSIPVANGKSVQVRMNAATGQLSLVTNSTSYALGQAFTLKRNTVTDTTGIKIAQARVPANLYPADLTFTAVMHGDSYKLFCVASMYIEDYLCGVVPYEIGESSSYTEALKAQAVASRTYALRKKSGMSAEIYDVTDTTSDQVYSGTPSGNNNCKLAVSDTRGLVLCWGNTYAATFYTASNGGQTESALNAWGDTGYSYLSVRDDPYDLCSNGKKASFTVKSQGKQDDAFLQTLLSNKLASTYGSTAVLQSIYDVKASKPKYPSPSRLYTRLTFDITYSQKGTIQYGSLVFDIFDELEGKLGMGLSSGDSELWSVEKTASGWLVTARRYGHGIGMSQTGAIYMAQNGFTCEQILAFYYPGCEAVTYNLTGTVASSAAVTNSPVTHARVMTDSNSLNLRASASSSSKVLTTIPKYTYIDIYEKGSTWCRTYYQGQYGYVMTRYLDFSGTATAATPAPTADVSESTTLYGRVTTSSGSLNLRQSVNGRVITTIPRNTLIPILQINGSWYKTSYNGLTGYVSKSFVTLVAANSTVKPTAVSAAAMPTATPALNGAVYARVNTQSGSLNLRSAASSSGRILSTIPKGTTVRVLMQGSVWSYIIYKNTSGYVMTQYLLFTGETAASATPAPTPTPVPAATPAADDFSSVPVEAGGSGYAVVMTKKGSLNLRREALESSPVLTYIPQFTRIYVQEKGLLWSRTSYKGFTGYVMSAYLAFENGATVNPGAVTPSPNAVRDSSMQALKNPFTATVASSNGSLNLRSGCSTSSPVLAEIPRYSAVTVIAVGNDWCKIQYGNRIGYCMRKYLSFEN